VRAKHHSKVLGSVAALSLACAGALQAQETREVIDYRGSPGMVDMPTAYQMPDGMVSISANTFAGIQRSAFHFQISPRMSALLRYTDINANGTDYQDRSFDFRYQILTETDRRPALALGFQDILGTGIYSGEYLVASKTFGRVTTSGGIGWGRMASSGGFDNPLGAISSSYKTRNNSVSAKGGNFQTDEWFHGDAALFGGLQYRATDRLSFAVEFSSDAYATEVASYGFERKSDVNLSASYQFDSGWAASLAWLYGSTVGFQLTHDVNAKKPYPLSEDPVAFYRAVGALAVGLEGQTPAAPQAPTFEYGLNAYLGPTFSDPDNGLAEGGLRATGSLHLTPAFSLNGEVRQPLFVRRVENAKTAASRASANYPQVRTNAIDYEDDTDLELRRLTADLMLLNGQSVFGKVSVGQFEEMYGGAAVEVLWKPQGSRLALGTEITYAKQRAAGTAFDFNGLDRTTGFVSAYYEFGDGYLGQLDVGQYLAGDRGATLTLAREFDTGVRLGVYATVTDMPAADFGEGSFDKGIQISVPASWLFGGNSKRKYDVTWRPNMGDGGARVEHAASLYEAVRAKR
jgi:hypothetical protein